MNLKKLFVRWKAKQITVLLFSLTIVFVFQGCKVGRFVWYNFSDVTDYKIFPNRPLHKSATPFYFTEALQNDAIEKRITIENYAHEKMDMKIFLEKSPTVAFLIIRNDTLMYEKYFRDYEAGTPVASFSMAKSYVSALIGIAIAEGKSKVKMNLLLITSLNLKGRKVGIR